MLNDGREIRISIPGYTPTVRKQASYIQIRHSWWERLIARLLWWDRRHLYFDDRALGMNGPFDNGLVELGPGHSLGQRWLARRALEKLARLM